MLGIIGAMEGEVSKLKEQMEDAVITKKASMEFYKGTIKGKEVVVVRSGIGKVNAAVCAQILIDDFHVSAIVNTGIAGSLKNEINIGDIVLSTDAVQHDVNAGSFGYPKGQIPGLDVLAFQADENLIEKAYAICEKVNPDISVFRGRVVTGDQFISQREIKNNIANTFDGMCTEMEGAAIAQVAYLNHIPSLIVRAISDKADDSADMDYEIFEAQAIKHSVNLTLELIANS